MIRWVAGALSLFAVALFIGALQSNAGARIDASEEPAWSAVGLGEIAASTGDGPLGERLRWTGDAAGVEAGSSTAEQWQLVGIADGEQPMALFIGSADKALIRLTVGETLPDGTVITDVGRDSTTVERAGCRRTLALFSLQRFSADGPCTDESNGKPE